MIEGKWYPKGSSTLCLAKLNIQENTFILTVEGKLVFKGDINTLNISNRLGNVERKIFLNDGSVFATLDNDSVDKIKQAKSLLHFFESKLLFVFLAIVITVVVSASFFKWGIPWASTHIAHALPHKANEVISSHTLEFLDKYMFKDSNISKLKQEEIQKHFKAMVLPLEDSNKYKLHFRLWKDGNLSIPNALALPSGDIILTDKFVQLCKTQEEMDSVLLHEIGHVEHRHTLEMVVESTFVTVTVMMIVGDSNGLADMGVGLGALLVSSSYSRGHEAEADNYAFNHMLNSGIDPIAFSDIMQRMDVYMQDSSIFKEDKKDEKSEKDILDYISSHPNTQKRMDIAKEYSNCFNQGKKTCDIKD